MKPTCIIAAAALLSASPALRAQETKRIYSTAEAGNHAGEYASVAGVIERVSTSRKGTEFVDLDGRYPDAPFSVVIPAADTGKVGDLSRYKGERVVVAGKIKLYKGRPEMVVESPDALKPEKAGAGPE